MDHLFLFSQDLDEEGVSCLKLNQAGEVLAPFEKRAFSDILKLQDNCYTVVVDPSLYASFFDLNLPWLAERKARIAIPYALEDQLVEPIDSLLFCYDKVHYQNEQYLIVVIKKERLRFIMDCLSKNQCDYSSITVDWFALQVNELLQLNHSLLIYTPDFKGALSKELAQTYLQKHPESQPIACNEIEIAKRLLNNKFMNLCQGEMQHGTQKDSLKKSAIVAGTVFGLWLTSLVLVNGIQLHILNKETAEIDSQIAKIYHQFFPDSKQVISPKFRINQLLQNHQNNDLSHFWFLLSTISKEIDSKNFVVEQLRYQNKALFLNLVSPDFTSLEDLEDKLRQASLQVKQTQASTREQQVFATLELS